jgi:SAM-dependent MidA family methyltransferase
MTQARILTSPLQTHISQAITQAGGWIGFDAFMHAALYTPGLGYYASDLRKFGLMPCALEGGSDFATAPEMSPRFGQALARQIAEAFEATGTREVWEFGAGSGALAEQILHALPQLARYTIVDVSGSLRARQQERLAAFAGRVHWATTLPGSMRGVVIGNEVLDAMPVKLLARVNGVWHERGVIVAPTLVASRTALPPEGAAPPKGGLSAGLASPNDTQFMFADQITDLRPPFEVVGTHDYTTEIHPQAEGFISTMADRLKAGMVLMVDYGFPEHEYYHPQRSMGTVMCHRAHLVDADPLQAVGSKDITAHVNFTGIALAGQDAGLSVLGYTGQGRFLLNCGVLEGMDDAALAVRVMVQKLINEHEMGELFKVIALGAKNSDAWRPMGFTAGDRTHTL